MNNRLSLLYVDDDADIRHIVELALGLDHGIRLRSVGSGVEAIALLESGWRPDAAMLDVMMPGISGLDLFRRVRGFPGTADMPVLFMTARLRSAEIAGYLDLGAVAVIQKPFDPLMLAGEIRRVLSAR